jgi:hypothetical protein
MLDHPKNPGPVRSGVICDPQGVNAPHQEFFFFTKNHNNLMTPETPCLGQVLVLAY